MVMLFAALRVTAAPPATNYPVTAIVSSNTVTFPVLLSTNSRPLMTNAVFHRTFGRKVIFGEDLAIQAFDVDELHPSVLAQLDLDPDTLKADQAAIDERYQQWAAAFRERVKQLLSTPAGASSVSAAAAGTNSATNSASTNMPPHHVHYRYARASAGKAAHKSPPVHSN